MSYNLTKSNNNKELNSEDCSVFLTSNKKDESSVKTSNGNIINDGKSLRLADLSSYELLKKNSFLESQNNYKLCDSDSIKNPSYNNDDNF